MILQAQRYQLVPRIGDQRHSCIAHQRNFCALLHGCSQFRGALYFVVLVVADQRLMNVVVREQLLCATRILAGDLIHFLEDTQRAQRDVFKVANRRTDKVQTACGILPLCRWILGGHAISLACALRSTRCARRGQACYTKAPAARRQSLQQCYTSFFECPCSGSKEECLCLCMSTNA